MARLTVKVIMNFLRDMLSAPAARTKGLSGMGGGRMAGRATERMAWDSHPVADAFEDAGRDVFFKEGHASALTDLMAEVSAERRAGRGEENEQDDVLLARGHHDDHDVGDAGEGQRDEGAVDDGDEEDAEDAEAEEEVQERGCGRGEEQVRSGGRPQRGTSPCLSGSREELHT